MKNKLIEPTPANEPYPIPVESGRFNWFAEIDYLLKGGIRSTLYLHNLMEYANSWISCACGQLDPRIKMNKGREGKTFGPMDGKLDSLGMEFMQDINISFNQQSIDFEALREAKETLIKIEQREAELLANLQ